MGVQQREPISDKDGTVERHVGECRDCGYSVGSDGSYDGYSEVEDILCRHIGAPGAVCHDFTIKAIYEDGGWARV